MDIKFDFSDFYKKFNEIVKNVIPDLIAKGLGVAMLDLKNDCFNEVPTVPLKEGWLRGSGSIFVQNKLIETTENMPTSKAGFANRDYSEGISMGSFVGVIGFNTPYAARMHEGIGLHFTEPSSGAKYLESKLHRKKDVYIADIADTIRKGGNA